MNPQVRGNDENINIDLFSPLNLTSPEEG